jgi:hypothetical protein
MLKNSLFFGLKEKYAVDIEFVGDSSNYRGKLIINPNNAPYLEIDFPNNFVRTSQKDIIRLIFCKSDNSIFTLIDNKDFGTVIYPKYIIKGKPFSKYEDIQFNGLHLYLSNFNKWIKKNNSNNFSDALDKIINFKVQVDTKKYNKIEISNNYRCSIVEDEIERRKSILEEFPTIDIYCKNDYFSLEKIINLSNEMKQIFTYLIGYSLNIYYAWAIIIKKENNKEYKEWIPIYTASVFNNQEKLENDIYSFIQAKVIENKNKWQDIFNNYYAKYNNFISIWSGIIGLLNYDDILDYEISGYVSILDNYLDGFISKQKKEELPEKVFENFKNELLAKVNELLVTHSQGEYKNVISSISGYITNLRNSNFPKLQEKFERWISTIDIKLRNIINLSPNDFLKIKKFKDHTSHSVKNDYSEDNINKLIIIKNKITLYLFYLIYIDLGFNTVDFIECLNLRFHPLKRSSNIDEEALDKALGKIPFIEVDKETFDKIGLLKNNWDIIFEHDKKGDYFFDEEITNKYRNTYVDNINKYSFTEYYVKDLYKDKNFKEVKYIGSIYICNEKLSKKLYNVFFVEI